MKIQSIMVAIFLLGNGPAAHAIPVSSSNDPIRTPTEICKVIPKGMFLYGYTDFNYDSNEGVNFYHFEGHSNTYGLAADNVELTRGVYAGLSIFRVDTSVDWRMSLAPGGPSASNQTLHNNTIFGHVLKTVTPHVYLDLGGAYGRASVNTQSLALAPGNGDFATAKFHNDNWFVSANAFYRTQWDNFDLTGNAGILYTEVNSDAFTMRVDSPVFGLVFIPNPALDNDFTMLVENVELGYKVNPYFRPFVNGGLFQVVESSASRSLLVAPVVGAVPQFFMDQNGFRLGAGLGISYNQFTVRLEEKYYNAGNDFISYQTLVTAQYLMD